jgi:hypothetical protein
VHNNQPPPHVHTAAVFHRQGKNQDSAANKRASDGANMRSRMSRRYQKRTSQQHSTVPPTAPEHNGSVTKLEEAICMHADHTAAVVWSACHHRSRYTYTTARSILQMYKLYIYTVYLEVVCTKPMTNRFIAIQAVSRRHCYLIEGVTETSQEPKRDFTQ